MGHLVQTISIDTAASSCSGVAISPDYEHMVVSCDNGTLCVISLPDGCLVRTIGAPLDDDSDDDVVKLRDPTKLCFSAIGNILVALCNEKHVQELTPMGDHVRDIAVPIGRTRQFVRGIAANSEFIAVGCWGNTADDHVLLFDAALGTLARTFGGFGTEPGKLMTFCNGIRFSSDGLRLFIAEADVFGCGRVSVFDTAGNFVRCIGDDGSTFIAPSDIEIPDSHDSECMLVLDSDVQRVWTVSHSGHHQGDPRVLARLPVEDGRAPVDPAALAMWDGKLLVLDSRNKRVLVYS